MKYLKQEGIFILTHDFRGFGPWPLGPVALGLGEHSTSRQECIVEEVCSPPGGQEAKREEGGIPISPSRTHPE
jgi:hypothetical protein